MSLADWIILISAIVFIVSVTIRYGMNGDDNDV